MKALIWFLRIVLALVMAVFIFASGMLLFSSQVKKEDPPVLLGYAPFTVASSEMTPSLYPGDLAILRMGSESEPGDIVAFYKEGVLTLRRVVGTSEEKYITQQEAFGQPDVDLLEPSLVEAVCVTYLPGCGTVAEFLYSPIGLAILVVVALVVLIVPAFLSGGTARLEGPLVDYGDDDPYAYEEPDPRPVRKASPPPARPAEPPRRPQKAAPPPAERRGGSHYKPRH